MKDGFLPRNVLTNTCFSVLFSPCVMLLHFHRAVISDSNNQGVCLNLP